MSSSYLYNLGFSLNSSDTPVGRFQQYDTARPNPTIANQSAAWFTHTGPNSPPPGFGDWFTPVSNPLHAGDWGNPQSDSGSINLDPLDFLAIRVFTADPNVANYRVRVTGVFGRGTGDDLPYATDELQSPLVMSTQNQISTLPRAVIDVDGSSGPNWVAPLSDGSWVSWLGAVHPPADDSANDYTFNVGVSVYLLNAPQGNPTLYTFGIDPRMHVGAAMERKRKHKHEAA
jgi:hypothetical protein